MSVINEYKDPMSGKVNHFARGSIKFINIKPVKGADADGVKRTHIPAKNGEPAKVIEATHTISFLIQDVDENNNVVDVNSQGEWVGMGEKKLHPSHADKVQVKFSTGYKDILPGMVVSFPLKVSKNGDKTYVNGTLSGKVFNILDESKAGAPAARAPASGNAPAASGNSVKIFGEITAINGNKATVNDEKLGSGDVILSDEQLSQVAVGGRMTAFIVKETGVITSGFKAYGAAGQNNHGGNKKKSNYDSVGVETGHAINALAILLDRGFKPKDELEVAKELHKVTSNVKAAEASRTGKELDAVGASAGNAVLNACRRVDIKSKNLQEDIEGIANKLLVELAEPLYAFITGETKVSEEKAAEPVKEPLANAPQTSTPPPVSSFDAPPLDFDDDIPFAPIGLQYANHTIYVL